MGILGPARAGPQGEQFAAWHRAYPDPVLYVVAYVCIFVVVVVVDVCILVVVVVVVVYVYIYICMY